LFGGRCHGESYGYLYVYVMMSQSDGWLDW